MFRGVTGQLILFTLVLCSFNQAAQVQLRTNLPHNLPPNKLVTFEIQINKEPNGGYARLEMRCDREFQVRAGDIKGAVFETTDTTAILIWAVSPGLAQTNISLRLFPVTDPGNYNFRFSFHYQQDDALHQFVARPYSLKYEDIEMPYLLSSGMELLRSLEEPAIPIPAVEPDKVVKKSPAEISQQVQQLKRDAKDAFLVGALEKSRISRKVDTLRRDMLALGDTTGNIEKSQKYLSLQKIIDKCAQEMNLAERVIVLSKSLEAQANDIERISKVALSSTTPVAKVKQTPVVKTTGTPSPPSSPASPPPAQPITSKKEAESAPAPITGEKGRVFRIQLGAFSVSPDLSEFKQAGAIILQYENQVYKVLQGSYESREQAVLKKQELAEMFPGCFIVTFENGQRLN